MTLSELKNYIDNMYDQLDPDTIDEWDIDGLEVCDGDNKTFVINLSVA